MKNKNKNQIKTKFFITICLIGVWILSFIFSAQLESILGLSGKSRVNQVSANVVENSDYYVSYIDVGQGNSCFVKLPTGETALIDGGDIEYGLTVGNFLRSHNVEVIDYLIATHADSDHIGGLNYVLENFEVKKIYRPFQISGKGTSEANFVANEYEELDDIFDELKTNYGSERKMARVTTEVYKKFITNIYTETYTSGGAQVDSEITVFYDGLKVSGENYCFEFFAPTIRNHNSTTFNLENYCERTKGYATISYGVSDINAGSAIFLLTCFDDSYLFTGDAPFSATSGSNFEELDFINSLTLQEKTLISNVSVLQLGHHGSKYSTSPELLELVKPDFIVISVGENNTYGHPHEETLEKINNLDYFDSIYCFRTDLNGTIEFSNIDETLKFSLEKDDNKNELKISVKVLSSIVCVFLIICVLAIKPKRNTR